MSSESTQEFSDQRISTPSPSEDSRDAGAPPNHAPSNGTVRHEVAGGRSEDARDSKPELPARKVSEAKIRMQNRLPALDDDADVSVQKEQIVTRDGKADLGFTGVLLASAAPQSAAEGHWLEYRIYKTIGEKHVFSRVKRTVFEGEDDVCEADVFDPSPSSVPSQLLRSAREIARSKPLTWMDAAVAFFGYGPLAKILYRKLDVRFEEQIS